MRLFDHQQRLKERALPPLHSTTHLWCVLPSLLARFFEFSRETMASTSSLFIFICVIFLLASSSFMDIFLMVTLLFSYRLTVTNVLSWLLSLDFVAAQLQVRIKTCPLPDDSLFFSNLPFSLASTCRHDIIVYCVSAWSSIEANANGWSARWKSIN